jgi:hypothetical protein
MRRRDFVLGLALTATTASVQAQQRGKVYRLAAANRTAGGGKKNQSSSGLGNGRDGLWALDWLIHDVVGPDLHDRSLCLLSGAPSSATVLHKRS